MSFELSLKAKLCLSFSVGFHTVRLDSNVPDYSDNCSDNCSDYSDNLKKKKKKVIWTAFIPFFERS